jgi:hypothetical protein
MNIICFPTARLYQQRSGLIMLFISFASGVLREELEKS